MITKSSINLDLFEKLHQKSSDGTNSLNLVITSFRYYLTNNDVEGNHKLLEHLTLHNLILEYWKFAHPNSVLDQESKNLDNIYEEAVNKMYQLRRATELEGIFLFLSESAFGLLQEIRTLITLEFVKRPDFDTLIDSVTHQDKFILPSIMFTDKRPCTISIAYNSFMASYKFIYNANIKRDHDLGNLVNLCSSFIDALIIGKVNRT